MAKADLIAKAEELNLELTGGETVAELETLLLAHEPTQSTVEPTKEISKFNCDNCEDSGLECIECGAGRQSL